MFEDLMMSLNHSDKVLYFKHQLKKNNYKEVTCSIAPADTDAAPCQAKFGYGNPESIEPVEYALQKQIEAGFLEPVQYDPKY